MNQYLAIITCKNGANPTEIGEKARSILAESSLNIADLKWGPCIENIESEKFPHKVYLYFKAGAEDGKIANNTPNLVKTLFSEIDGVVHPINARNYERYLKQLGNNAAELRELLQSNYPILAS